MQLDRVLTFIVLSAFFLSPVLMSWWEEAEHLWYRPYLIWLFIIVATAWANHRREHHDI